MDTFDRSLDLIKKVEEFSKINKDLKDRNDELEINLQILPKKSIKTKKCKECTTLSENKDLLHHAECKLHFISSTNFIQLLFS